MHYTKYKTMKKSELWEVYVQKNPSFAGEKTIHISPRGLRKMFDTTWDIAFNEGEPEEDIEQFNGPVSGAASIEYLRTMFGMR